MQQQFSLVDKIAPDIRRVMWDIRNVGCSRCRMFEMWEVWDVEWWGCGMFEMYIFYKEILGVRVVNLSNLSECIFCEVCIQNNKDYIGVV